MKHIIIYEKFSANESVASSLNSILSLNPNKESFLKSMPVWSPTFQAIVLVALNELKDELGIKYVAEDDTLTIYVEKDVIKTFDKEFLKNASVNKITKEIKKRYEAFLKKSKKSNT